MVQTVPWKAKPFESNVVATTAMTQNNTRDRRGRVRRQGRVAIAAGNRLGDDCESRTSNTAISGMSSGLSTLIHKYLGGQNYS